MDDLQCHQCKHRANETKNLKCTTLKSIRKKINCECGNCDTVLPSMLKLQQQTHNQHELTKSPNSQITDSQYGNDESLRELLWKRCTSWGTKLLCWPIKTTNNFPLREVFDYIGELLDHVFAKKRELQKRPLVFHTSHTMKLVTIDIATLPKKQWYSIRQDC